MNINNYSFIVASYDGRDTAQAALKTIESLRQEKSLSYKDAVAMKKKSNGKVKLYQSKETKGIVGGGAAGLLAGALIPGVGMLFGAVVGMVIGGLEFKGLENKDLKKIGKDLGENESALFVLVNEADWDAVEAAMPEAKAILHREVLSVEVVEAFEKVSTHDDVAEAMSEVYEEEAE